MSCQLEMVSQSRALSLPSVMWQQAAEYVQFEDVKNLRQTSKLLQVAMERAEANYRRKCRQVLASGRSVFQVLGGLECSDYCVGAEHCASWMESWLQSFEAIRHASVFSETAGTWQNFAATNVQFEVDGVQYRVHRNHISSMSKIWWMETHSGATYDGSCHREYLRKLACRSMQRGSTLRLGMVLDLPHGETACSLRRPPSAQTLRVLDIHGTHVEVFDRVPWTVEAWGNSSVGGAVQVQLRALVRYRPRGPRPTTHA